MDTLKKNWAFLVIAGVSLLLGVLAVLTAIKLQEEKPVAPTAPESKPKALEGIPVPECTLEFTLTLVSPTPGPSATPGGPTPTPSASASPSATPTVTPSASPSVSPTPSVTPGTGGPTPSPVPTPTPTPTPTATPTPSASVSPSASASPGIGWPTPSPSPSAPSIDLVKTASLTQVKPGDTIKYTVFMTNNGSVPAYDMYFEENLDNNTDYRAPSMTCTFTDNSTGSSYATNFEIDDLSDGFDTTPDSETSSLDVFRVAGDLTENNNHWDLDVNDRITCSYEVTVHNDVPNGTNLTNVVVVTVDNQNNDNPNEITDTDTDTTTVTVAQVSVPAASVIPEVPRAGTSWPTLLLIIGGALLLLFSLAVL